MHQLHSCLICYANHMQVPGSAGEGLLINFGMLRDGPQPRPRNESSRRWGNEENESKITKRNEYFPAVGKKQYKVIKEQINQLTELNNKKKPPRKENGRAMTATRYKTKQTLARYCSLSELQPSPGIL
jgi:hypothetical protein